jgi:hypothetical protein
MMQQFDCIIYSSGGSGDWLSYLIGKTCKNHKAFLGAELSKRNTFDWLLCDIKTYSYGLYGLQNNISHNQYKILQENKIFEEIEIYKLNFKNELFIRMNIHPPGIENNSIKNFEKIIDYIVKNHHSRLLILHDDSAESFKLTFFCHYYLFFYQKYGYNIKKIRGIKKYLSEEINKVNEILLEYKNQVIKFPITKYILNQDYDSFIKQFKSLYEVEDENTVRRMFFEYSQNRLEALKIYEKQS